MQYNLRKFNDSIKRVGRVVDGTLTNCLSYGCCSSKGSTIKRTVTSQHSWLTVKANSKECISGHDESGCCIQHAINDSGNLQS